MANLTAAQRRAIPKSDFGVPEKAPGSGSFPLPDKKHARAALRLIGNASPANQTRIRSKISRLWPGIKQAGRMHSLSSFKAL